MVALQLFNAVFHSMRAGFFGAWMRMWEGPWCPGRRKNVHPKNVPKRMPCLIPTSAWRQPTPPKVGRKVESGNRAQPMIRKYLTRTILGGLAAACPFIGFR